MTMAKKSNSISKTIPKVRFKIHKGQAPIWRAGEQFREIWAIAGEQGGKSIFGIMWFLRELSKYADKPYNYVVGAPTYKILHQSTTATFFKIFTDTMGKYDGQEEVFRLNPEWGGGNIYFRTSRDPDSVVGIPNVKAALLDEAGKCSRLFYYNIRGRLARLQGRLCGVTTPYAINFVKKEVIDLTRHYYNNGMPDTNRIKDPEKERHDVAISVWKSILNPTYPQEEYERNRLILPAKIFNRRFAGLHEKMEGLVYDDLDEVLNFCDPFIIPKGARVFGGVDWGFDHAYAIVIRVILPNGMRYNVSEFKQSGLTPQEKIDVAKSKAALFHVEHWYCGSDRPDMIEAFNKAGLPASSYWPKENTLYRQVLPGIEAHAELIKSRRLKIWRDRCPELVDEYNTYHWPNDIEKNDDDKVTKEKPVDVNDDLMDADRHVTVGTLYVYNKPETAGTKKPVKDPAMYDSWSPKQRKRVVAGG